MEQKDLLVMKSITKTFPGVKALDDVNLNVRENEIHFIVGENGAGKSTLVKVLSGIHPSGSFNGDIIFDNEIRHFHGTKDSTGCGIVIINQELALFPNLSIYENIFVGNEKKRGQLFMDWNDTQVLAKKYLDMVGLEIDIHEIVGKLSVGKQQLIEIAKALAHNVKLLILDEPTSALNEDDSANLLKLLKDLKQDGITSIMISHKLKEVEIAADSLTILRDGKTVRRMEKAEINEAEIIRHMVGREIEDIFPKRPKYKPQEVVFETIHWTAFDAEKSRNILTDINIKVRKGEVVGISGLMGAGRTELALSIFGNTPKYKTSGNIVAFGKPVKFSAPSKAIRSGIAYVSEDRRGNGLILKETISENVTLAALHRISRTGIINYSEMDSLTNKYVDELTIRTPSVLQTVKNLSGGNQQKVQVGKWLCAEPKILFLDEPTRGIDVGAKYEIYTIINALIDKGMSIVRISSELPEILGMCDRIYVIAEGIQTAEFDISEATPEKIMEKATV